MRTDIDTCRLSLLKDSTGESFQFFYDDWTGGVEDAMTWERWSLTLLAVVGTVLGSALGWSGIIDVDEMPNGENEEMIPEENPYPCELVALGNAEEVVDGDDAENGPRPEIAEGETKRGGGEVV